MNDSIIKEAAEKFGTPLHIFDAERFDRNYKELDLELNRFYPKHRIAYSFKTNYTPAVCKRVLKMGGLAEVVSGMEYNLARKIGFEGTQIVVNGPGKIESLNEMLCGGALVLLDNLQEVKAALNYEGATKARIGLRLNFEIGSGKDSRFGFDINGEEIKATVNLLKSSLPGNLSFEALSFHLSGARSLEAWGKRAEKMAVIVRKFREEYNLNIQYLDLGSGMFGHLNPKLAEQFGQYIPSFREYSEIISLKIDKIFESEDRKPCIIVEPGTTVVADTFDYCTKIVAVKHIRSRNIAVTDGSFQQLGELCVHKKLPVRIIKSGSYTDNLGEKLQPPIEITGYTCLENDIMYPSFDSETCIGDMICFENAGSYSIVLKPPFIKEACPIVKYEDGAFELVRRKEEFQDIFGSYAF